MVRHWPSMTVEDDAVVHDGLGHVMGQSLGFSRQTMVPLGIGIFNGFRGISAYLLVCFCGLA